MVNADGTILERSREVSMCIAQGSWGTKKGESSGQRWRWLQSRKQSSGEMEESRGGTRVIWLLRATGSALMISWAQMEIWFDRAPVSLWYGQPEPSQDKAAGWRNPCPGCPQSSVIKRQWAGKVRPLPQDQAVKKFHTLVAEDKWECSNFFIKLHSPNLATASKVLS